MWMCFINLGVEDSVTNFIPLHSFYINNINVSGMVKTLRKH